MNTRPREHSHTLNEGLYSLPKGSIKEIKQRLKEVVRSKGLKCEFNPHRQHLASATK